ncbi:MAG: sulfatase/phosphatase domain-containing protein, partial [Verrucomicrobiota bacterium]|nr:sulfatase/phosphatase domain-containing protein [Verrucomicrobiota bacterium]
KGSADEGGVRVPFFVRWQGKFGAGREIEKLSAHIDLLPTLADIAGISKFPKGQIDGRSLVPLLKNPKAEWRDRYLFTHKGRWQTGTEPTERKWKGFAVRNERFRLVENNLYDMKKDPAQTQNVSEEYPQVVKSMRKAYEEFWEETRPLMVNENVPMSPTRPYHELYETQLKVEGIPDWEVPKL